MMDTLLRRVFDGTLKLIFIGILLIAGTNVAATDEVEELINDGKRAYQENNLSAATQNLQQALNLIAELSVQSYMALLPPPPKGWVVKEDSADQNSLFGSIGGFVIATKRYKQLGADKAVQGKHDSAKGTMQIALVTNLPPYVQQALQAMIALRNVAANLEEVIVSGFSGSVSCTKQGKCDLLMKLGDKAVVTAESQHVTKKEFLTLVRGIKLEQFMLVL